MVLSIMIAVTYIVIVAYLGYKGWKKAQTTSDYMIAGRETHPYVMATSYGVTFISTSAIIGFGGAAALFGFPLLWLTFLNVFVGIFIAFVFFGRRTRRMGVALNAHTFPEVLGKRYQSRFVQGFAAMVIFLFIPVYAAAILIGISRFIEVYLHIPYAMGLLTFSLILVLCVIFGGLKAVLYIDAFQGTIMFIMMMILCIWTYSLLGGIIPAHQALTDITHMVPEKLVKGGHMGWTAGMKFDTPLWWIVYSTIIYGVGIGVLAHPQLAMRLMTVRSNRGLNRAMLVGGIFILAMTGTAFIVGSLTNAVFAQKFGKISVAMARGNIDKIIPIYIDKVMPTWFGTLFLLGILVASMSTLGSQYHVGGTSLGRDFYGKALGLRRAGEVFSTKIGVTLTIIATILWGLLLPPSIIAIATAFFFGLCGASFLPTYFLGLYWKGATKAGALTSMVGGFCISFFWLVSIHYKGSKTLGVCTALFGKVNLVANYPSMSGMWKLQFVDPNIVALPISFILCIVVSHVTKKMPEDHINICFKYIK
ncbi:MAG: sodium:solute symporter family protein [Deltaproteobacteria bacterium]|nr:sodium:solute symporter family protein [Deltaproteobacteria bacterium]